MNPIKEAVRFCKDRNLDKQEFNYKVMMLNFLEELVETTGLESSDARKVAEEIFQKYFENKLIVDKELLLDAITDIRVFAIDSTLKLGYNPECALLEVAKEINSRTGKIVDGKFVKDKSPEAKARWYKANFKKCLI